MTQKHAPASASRAAGYNVFYGYDLRGLQLYARFGSATGQGVTSRYDGFGRQASSSSNMGGVARAVISGVVEFRNGRFRFTLDTGATRGDGDRTQRSERQRIPEILDEYQDRIDD
jgi:hypothetical protein